MGCACLRGDGRPWPVRRAGRVAPRGRQGGSIAYQPDAAGSHARAQLLCRGRDPDAIRLGVAEGEPDPDSDPNAYGIGEPVRDRDRQRLGYAMPIADRDGHPINVAQRQREAIGLALG